MKDTAVKRGKQRQRRKEAEQMVILIVTSLGQSLPFLSVFL